MQKQPPAKTGSQAKNEFPLHTQRQRGSEPEPEEIDEAELFDEPPGVALIQRFSATVTRVPWFARIAEPLNATVDALAREYLDMLGFPDMVVSPVDDWQDADAAAASLDWDSAGWEAEEQLRVALMSQALEIMGEEKLTLLLTHVSAQAADPIEIGVREAAALYDVEDPTLIDAAIGAGAQACYLAALALAVAEDPAHPFIQKFRLFEAGRWPIGLAGNSFNLF